MSVGRRLRRLRPEPGALRQDAVAGIPGAIGSVPDGMASAVLAGVNPVHGLYASFIGPIAGGAFARQLFHVDEDRSEAHDLAEQHPDKLEELKAKWLEEAKNTTSCH